MGSERSGGWPESTQHTAGSDPGVKSLALSQDLPLTHSAMPEGSLGSPAAGVGEDSRLLRREQEEGDLFSGGRNPAGGTPPPDIQTPTHSSTAGCHGNRTLGQAPRPLSAGSRFSSCRPPPAPPHPRAPEDRAWAASPAPRTPLLLPLDLRLPWGSGKNRGRCGVNGQPARPGGSNTPGA